VTAPKENEIGRCRCPVCESDKASLRVSAKQLAYVTCNTCNTQIFARSDRSDSMLRGRLVKAEAAPVVEPEAKPAPAAKSAPGFVPSWGIFGRAQHG
jgi:hypothetical protein